MQNMIIIHVSIFMVSAGASFVIYVLSMSIHIIINYNITEHIEFLILSASSLTILIVLMIALNNILEIVRGWNVTTWQAINVGISVTIIVYILIILFVCIDLTAENYINANIFNLYEYIIISIIFAALFVSMILFIIFAAIDIIKK